MIWNETRGGAGRRALLAGAGGLLAGALAAPRVARAAGSAVLRVGNQKGGLRSLLEASGAANDLPYRIEWSEFSAAAPLLEALNAAAIDTGTMGDLAFLSVFASGAPIRAVGATRADPRSQAILVRDGGPIRALADLRGRKVAGNRGGWGQFLIRAALKREGIDPSAVEIVFLQPPEASLAFRSGAVDAWAIWEPFNALEIQTFGARTLVDGTGLTPTISFTAANEAALRDRRSELADLLRRQRDGWNWARNNIPAYAQSTSRLTRLPEPAVRRAYEVQQTRAIALDDAVVAELQRAADLMAEFGMLSRPLDVSRALDTSFAHDLAG